MCAMGLALEAGTVSKGLAIEAKMTGELLAFLNEEIMDDRFALEAGVMCEGRQLKQE